MRSLLLLVGEYDVTVDEKSRVLVPSEIRKSINAERDGDSFYLVIGVNRNPWLYTERFYEELVSQAPAELSPGEELLAYDQMYFGMASKIDMDKQGRILIPEKTLKRTGLKREITLVGVRDHMELWNRDQWSARQDALLDRMSEVALRAKQARQMAGLPPATRPIMPGQAT